MLTLPASGASNPAIRRRVVLLPQPLGPSSARKPPEATSRSTASTARVEPKSFGQARRLDGYVVELGEPASRATPLPARAPPVVRAQQPGQRGGRDEHQQQRRRRRLGVQAAGGAVQVAVASVLKPIGLSSSVTGSSFTADMNTSAAPPSAAGAMSGAVIEANTWWRAAAEARRRLLQSRVHLQQAAAQGADGLGQEPDHVGEHQQREGLVQQRAKLAPKNTRASATTMPGSAKLPYVMRSTAAAERARVAHREHGHRDGGQQGDRRRGAGRVARAEERAATASRSAPTTARFPAPSQYSRTAAGSTTADQRRAPHRSQRGRCPASELVVSSVARSCARSGSSARGRGWRPRPAG